MNKIATKDNLRRKWITLINRSCVTCGLEDELTSKHVTRPTITLNNFTSRIQLRDKAQ